MQALLVEGVDEGAYHMLLADQLLEGLRPPFPRQNLIAHQFLREALS